MFQLVANQKDVALTTEQQQEIATLLSQADKKAVYLFKTMMESGETRIILVPADLAMQETMQLLNGTMTVLTASNEQVRAEAQETIKKVKEEYQKTISEQAATITQQSARIAQLEALQAQMTTTHQAQLQAIVDASKQNENKLNAQMSHNQETTKNKLRSIGTKVDVLMQQIKGLTVSTQNMRSTVINPYPGGGHRRDALESFIAVTTAQNYNNVTTALMHANNGLHVLKGEVQ